jgi:glycosyltransferase involved in cell wall biosynthesis
MHIAVNGWFWGQMNTGSGQYLHHLARCLPEIDDEQRYTMVLPQTSGAAAPAGWQVVAATPAARRLGANLAKLWFEQVSFPRACNRLGADVAFTPYWGAPWQQPCPGAVTVHDLIPLLLPAYRGGALQRAYTWLVTETARRADLVLTDSLASRQDIVQQLAIPAERVHAVLLAADERFQPVSDPAELARVRQRYGLPDAFILYLGGFDVRKNVAGVVRAYARWAHLEMSFFPENDISPSPYPSEMSFCGKNDISPSPHPPEMSFCGKNDISPSPYPSEMSFCGKNDISPSPHPPEMSFYGKNDISRPWPQLVIAGKLPDADTPFAPDPRRMVTEAGIAERVHFTGWVDEADKPALYSLASLFVFPSLYEGYGLPVAEAAACGTPVLTSNRSSLPEAAPGAMLVDPEDVDALAAAMAQALQAPRTTPPDPRRTWLDVARETLNHLKELS